MKDALGHGSNAHNTGIEQIPPKGANELRLFGDNDANLYRQSKQPIEKNLDKKIAKGLYDHEMATKLWGYHADRAAQMYNRQHADRPGQKWSDQFPPATRRAAAKSWADEFQRDRNVKGSVYGTDKSGNRNTEMTNAASNRVRPETRERTGADLLGKYRK